MLKGRAGFSLLFITNYKRRDIHWKKRCHAKRNQNLKIWNILNLSVFQTMRKHEPERTPTKWQLDHHWVRGVGMQFVGPVNHLRRSLLVSKIAKRIK